MWRQESSKYLPRSGKKAGSGPLLLLEPSSSRFSSGHPSLGFVVSSTRTSLSPDSTKDEGSEKRPTRLTWSLKGLQQSLSEGKTIEGIAIRLPVQDTVARAILTHPGRIELSQALTKARAQRTDKILHVLTTVWLLLLLGLLSVAVASGTVPLAERVSGPLGMS